MARLANDVGVALLVGFIAGAIFLFCQLLYAQLVLMPRLIASGDRLAVSVGIRPALQAAAVAFVVYLTVRMWPGRKR